MVLSNREIRKKEEIVEIINKSEVCYISFVDDNKPYVLPFNFGYENDVIYIHCAGEGKKIDILKKNNNVCINFTVDYKLFFRDKEVACSYGMKFRSVIAEGKAVSIEDYDEKVRIMNLIMKKYTGEEFKYNSPAINNIKIFKVEVETITGKKYGY